MRQGESEDLRETGLLPPASGSASSSAARVSAANGLFAPPLASAAPKSFFAFPANASGLRARMLCGGKGRSELARRLKETGVPLGELFSFMSALYFRGKLAYAAAFANPPAALPGILIITPACGLLRPETVTTLADLRGMTSASVKHTNPLFREPLERDARLVLRHLGADGRVILLGSVATPKYVEPLLAIFGERLEFPRDFAGLGNMSRGALLLRSSRNRDELQYAQLSGTVVGRPAPAKVPQRRKRSPRRKGMA